MRDEEAEALVEAGVARTEAEGRLRANPAHCIVV
jgi:hypothetical protein